MATRCKTGIGAVAIKPHQTYEHYLHKETELTNKEYTPNGGYAEVVQHSIDEAGNEIITFNVKYALSIHAEALRHRMLSRGVKSQRAIPTWVIRKEVLEDPYVPVWFGANQAGMVADSEVKYKWLATKLWRGARYPAVFAHWLCEKLGGHKEWANRLLSPYQWVRETITATEWDNFYNLRIHTDAQKDIKVIAEAMYAAHKKSKPLKLEAGEYHVPYVDRSYVNNQLRYLDTDGTELTVEKAIKCSAARCARSSYDKHDGGLPTYDGDIKLYHMLIDSEPAHASPVEHQGTPMALLSGDNVSSLCNGETHLDKDGSKWSGNFKGFIQYRQTLENHTCYDYKG